MKVVFIPAKSPMGVKLSASALKKLPKQNYGVVTTVQHVDMVNSVLDQLPGSVLAGQVLGCNALCAEELKDDVDAFLYVGTGEFHPLNVAFRTSKPVWVWNPVSRTLTQLDEKRVAAFLKRKQVLFSKYFAADNVGILVSLKWGQNSYLRAKAFAGLSDKDCYIFVADTLDLSELENFPFIDCWVSSACPRLADDVKGIINLDDLIDFLGLNVKGERPIWTVPLR